MNSFRKGQYVSYKGQKALVLSVPLNPGELYTVEVSTRTLSVAEEDLEPW